MKSKQLSKSPPRTRILVVDDHPLFRKGLADFINAQSDLTVCGEAGNPREALDAISSAKPDLVLTDLNLPGKGGVELIKDIHALHPNLLIIVITMHEESHHAERVLMAGARGFITKTEHAPKLLAAIRQVLKGKMFVTEQVSAHILERFAGGGSPNGNSPVDLLTDRELHIFSLIGNARSSREIAAALIISIKTVEAHRANIKQKLGLRNAQELMRAAVCWVEAENPERPPE